MLSRKKRFNLIEFPAAERAINAEDITEAYMALGNVKDQELRARIAIESENKEISRIALGRVQSKKLLKKVANETKHEATRVLAQKLLKT